ncbi:hypothetical protein ACQKJ1_26375 [Methylorubrum rhodesianum]|uniref:hypothetical protein n=1 Tax=Methylorubrum rhodesianum TaxID=29427 RepID=UPI003CFDAF8A
MTVTANDSAAIEAQIAIAETRSNCRMGMAATRTRFAIVLDAGDAAVLRVKPRLSLHVAARQGAVDLWYTAAAGAMRGISAEPGEPDRQALLVSHARRNPVAAALDLLRQDLERVLRRAEEIADEAFEGVDENVTLNGSDYAWDASEALDIYCEEHAQELADDGDLRAMAAAVLQRRLAKAQADHLAELAAA